MAGNAGLPEVAEPGGRPPAPGALRLLQRFVNTEDREAGSDALADAAALTAWLRAAGLLAVGERPATRADLALAHAVRDELRALFLAHHDGRPAPAGAALAKLTLVARPRDGGLRLAPAAAGARGALARLVAIAAEADPRELARLRACRRDACRWVFYDASRNRSGVWCSMDVCGARTKMAAYRRRARRRAA